jgi:hypothetical protein
MTLYHDINAETDAPPPARQKPITEADVVEAYKAGQMVALRECMVAIDAARAKLMRYTLKLDATFSRCRGD